MATAVTIPRFLLPRGDSLLRYTRNQPLSNVSLLYRHPLLSSSRHASTSKPNPKSNTKSSSNVLAKPLKFNPPSHPSRIVKPSPIRQYGPALTSDQKETHKTKQYPHMLPPKGSFMDRFLHSRALHTSIALGVLVIFAAWTLVLDFKATSPYAGQFPGLYDWTRHPLDSAVNFWDKLRLHILHDSQVAETKRARMISETMKTKAYRVMHGLEPLKGQPTEVQILVAQMRGEYDYGKDGEEPVVVEQEIHQKRPIKKWLGIW